MDRFSFLGSAHGAFIEELYEQYLDNPDGVEPSWRGFFQGYDFSRSTYSEDLEDKQVPEELLKEFDVLDMINEYRTRGHLFTKTNPVRERRSYQPDLNISNFGLKEEDLNSHFQAAVNVGMSGPAPLREIIEHLEAIYCGSIGIEYMYSRRPKVISWIQDRIHPNDNRAVLSEDEKRHTLRKLNEAVAFESFLNTKFVGQKRFSIEGAESLIPGLDFMLQRASEIGVEEVVLGMAHRGRLNVLTNLMGKPASQVFSEFSGKEFMDDNFDGDVKYHLGFTADRLLNNGKRLKINLAPNPSHLEAVGPVVEGIARAKGNGEHKGYRDKVLPILIHGDAAVAGQGVVYEVVQMERLDGYGTGGTIHVVINNQVGFTTNYIDGRSSTYCTDVAKVVLAPVLHVNGDDVEAVIHAMRFAIEYRQKWQRNVFIDLLCYRKYGHNEGDEPRFTQPKLYKAIAKHLNPLAIYHAKLIAEGQAGANLVKEMDVEFKSMLEGHFDEAKGIEKNVIVPFMEKVWLPYPAARPGDVWLPSNTKVSLKALKGVAKAVTTLPEGKNFFKKVVKLMKGRHEMAFESNAIDWGMGEMLAYGTLLQEGFHVRISGEDVERGTFSHRHAILKVENSEEEVCLLDQVPEKLGRFAIYNSHLSEYAVLGFDYGYAMTSPDTLVIWEAQFGDFANGAQIVIDQFIASAEDKWKTQNGLVLLLPHGYEGQGAEHSSARLERFLQLCAHDNMFICNTTSPANHYHMLRRQMHQNFRKPLVVMSPKSLLRHPAATSTLEDFAEGTFQPLIADDLPVKGIDRVVFCSGKLYYELLEERTKINDTRTALVRLEQIYPLPMAAIRSVLKQYPKAAVIWSQEEPANMGAWTFMNWKFPVPLILVAPVESAASASGSNKAALAIQRAVVTQTFEQ